MLTLLALGVVAYFLRRPLCWIAPRLIAFAFGFVIGWRWMECR